jgi:hypothetical protein
MHTLLQMSVDCRNRHQAQFCPTIVTYAALVSNVRVRVAIVAVDIERSRMFSERLDVCRLMRSLFLLPSGTEAFSPLRLPFTYPRQCIDCPNY